MTVPDHAAFVNGAVYKVGNKTMRFDRRHDMYTVTTRTDRGTDTVVIQWRDIALREMEKE